MLPTQQGAFRLFRAVGIDVFVHWSWFAVALYEIQNRRGRFGYTSLTWNILEYLSIFLIVLMHEFGHALACRQVGGFANQIVLWPLGGVAYVAPPPRPGAVLWSIVAGPLVNFALLPILYFAQLNAAAGWAQNIDNLPELLRALWTINLIMLLFNLLPIYPLDGGQILRALLWFPLGPIRSLYIATVVGFIGALGIAALALHRHHIWIGIMAAFIFMNCLRAWKHARALSAGAL